MAKRAARSEPKPTSRTRSARPSRARVPGNGANGDALLMAVEPSEEDIRVRAYHLYLERGAVHGADFDDWVTAERELKVAHN